MSIFKICILSSMNIHLLSFCRKICTSYIKSSKLPSKVEFKVVKSVENFLLIQLLIEKFVENHEETCTCTLIHTSIKHYTRYVNLTLLVRNPTTHQNKFTTKHTSMKDPDPQHIKHCTSTAQISRNTHTLLGFELKKEHVPENNKWKW